MTSVGQWRYGVEMEFEWDEAKNSACFERRGFDFAYAVPRLPRSASDRRAGPPAGLRRGTATGCSAPVDGRAYVVVYTARGSAIRIISARKANPKEVADYDHNARQD